LSFIKDAKSKDDNPTYWKDVYHAYIVDIESNKLAMTLYCTLYMAVIPTLMYTLHNYEVLNRASDPESSRQTTRQALVTTFGLGLILTSLWLGLESESYFAFVFCTTFVVFNYLIASCLLGGTICKAKGLARKRE
jgi:hypothetical protein